MSSPSVNLPFVSDNNKASGSANDQSTQPVQNEVQAEPTRDAGKRSKARLPSKFTRGEKCLFIHVVVTFTLLLLLFIIFMVHLYAVEHHGKEIFEGLLRTRVADKRSYYTPVGMVYVLPNNYMCNSLLLRPKWSLAPAHCVAARSDPDLAPALPNWRVMYGKNGDLDEKDFSETLITRSVPHPHFNRDDFQNNVGLFQHEDEFSFSNVYIGDVSLSDYTLKTNENDLKLTGWEEDSWHLYGQETSHPVQPLSSEKCKQYVAPVVDKREYEFCVTLKQKRNVTIAPGAVLAMKNEYVGIFTWGDSKGRGLPFVILDLAHYKDWIQHIVA